MQFICAGNNKLHLDLVDNVVDGFRAEGIVQRNNDECLAVAGILGDCLPNVVKKELLLLCIVKADEIYIVLTHSAVLTL